MTHRPEPSKSVETSARSDPGPLSAEENEPEAARLAFPVAAGSRPLPAPRVTRQNILALQQTIGNQAVQRLIRQSAFRPAPRPLQPVPPGLVLRGNDGFEKFSKNEMNFDEAYFEQIAYAIAYKDRAVGDPVYRAKDGPSLRIDKVFGAEKEDFRAYGIVINMLYSGYEDEPQTVNAPAILVFRGCRDFTSYLTGALNPQGIGYDLYQKRKAEVGAWLRDHVRERAGRPPVKPVVIGHSMGGAMAQMATVDFAEFVGHTYTFGAAPLGQEYTERAKQRQAELKEQFPRSTHFMTEPDLTPTRWGYGHTPGTAVKIKPHKPLSAIQAHSEPILYDPSTFSREDKSTDTLQYERGTLESGRQAIGGALKTISGWFSSDKPAPAAASSSGK